MGIKVPHEAKGHSSNCAIKGIAENWENPTIPKILIKPIRRVVPIVLLSARTSLALSCGGETFARNQRMMPSPEVMKAIEQALHEFLMWVGFGTLVGLFAKAIMPGRDPGGAVATLMMGIVGSVIGCGSVMFFWDGHRVSPLSFIGFAAAVAGAFLLLLFYRILAGGYFVEAEPGDEIIHQNLRRRRRKALKAE
jgi:uncharacterized membrane protein YeaQ/YmgE (transglycosylase-associated protein family)